MIQFLLVSLGVFAVWEYLRMVLPFSIPALLQPLVVIGLAVGATHLDREWVFPLAVAGAVAILHRFVLADSTPTATALQLPRRSGRRSEVGSRVPPLP